MKFFCPKCWKEIEEECKTCPHCGYEISKYGLLSYEDKLIHSLNHPIDEFKINAIRILGNIGGEKAISAFEKLIDIESSVPILLEVIESLRKLSFNFESAYSVLKKLTKHKAKVVRESAISAIREIEVHN